MIIGCALAVAGVMVLPGLVFGPPPLSINLSESLPRGVYWTRPLPGTETRPHAETVEQQHAPDDLLARVGMLVSACLPPQVAENALTRGYLTKGPCPSGSAPVGKFVAAVAGDTVDVTDLGSFVNGSLLPSSAPLLRDGRGRAMPPVRGRFVLPLGKVWLYSGHSPRSFDSRYYGPVPLAGVQGELIPLLTGGKISSFEDYPEVDAGGPRARARAGSAHP